MDKLKIANSVAKDAINNLFNVRDKSKHQITKDIPLIVLENSEEPLQDQILSPDKPNNSYEKDFKMFKFEVERILKMKTKYAKDVEKDENFIFKEIDCIKFILNDWIYCSSNLSQEFKMYLFDNDLYVFKGFLLHLASSDLYLEYLETILKIFKQIIIKNGSFDWILFYKQVYDEIQAIFYDKYNAILDIDDS